MRSSSVLLRCAMRKRASQEMGCVDRASASFSAASTSDLRCLNACAASACPLARCLCRSWRCRSSPSFVTCSASRAVWAASFASFHCATRCRRSSRWASPFFQASWRPTASARASSASRSTADDDCAGPRACAADAAVAGLGRVGPPEPTGRCPVRHSARSCRCSSLRASCRCSHAKCATTTSCARCGSSWPSSCKKVAPGWWPLRRRSLMKVSWSSSAQPPAEPPSACSSADSFSMRLRSCADSSSPLRQAPLDGVEQHLSDPPAPLVPVPMPPPPVVRRLEAAAAEADAEAAEGATGSATQASKRTCRPSKVSVSERSSKASASSSKRCRSRSKARSRSAAETKVRASAGERAKGKARERFSTFRRTWATPSQTSCSQAARASPAV
mmetsp:Transcript_108656/g.346890  ORF Transcript_108656/g.346890 Transcript_108656/m.346890 type:complete len:388 (-) Transcript_108656:215-1378(-)